jgi:hypothetical protein
MEKMLPHHLLPNRRLVVRNEGAGHPLRRMLPPPVLTSAAPTAKPPKWWMKEDTHLFMLSFTAFFVVFFTFIA